LQGLPATHIFIFQPAYRWKPTENKKVPIGAKERQLTLYILGYFVF